MKEDIRRLEYIPGSCYNFHPGSHVGQGEDVGIARRQLPGAVEGLAGSAHVQLAAGQGEAQGGVAFGEVRCQGGRGARRVHRDVIGAQAFGVPYEVLTAAECRRRFRKLILQRRGTGLPQVATRSPDSNAISGHGANRRASGGAERPGDGAHGRAGQRAARGADAGGDLVLGRLAAGRGV